MLRAPILTQIKQLWIVVPKFAAKVFLGLEFQKSKFWFGISNLQILGAPIFRQRKQLWIFGLNLPKNGIGDSNIKNLSPDLESASLKYYVHQFWDKTNNFEFFGLDLPKTGFWDWNMKKSKCRFAMSILEILCITMFRQKRQVWILGLKFALKWIFRWEFQVLIQNQHPWDSVCTNFYTNQTNLIFWTQIWPKNNFRVGISKI